MAYNAGKNVTPLHVRKNSITTGLGEKNSCTNQITHTPNTPPPRLPQNSNGIAAFDFVFMLRQRRTKGKKGNKPKLAICNI